MRPTLFELGIFEFHSYTVFMALGFLVGTILPVQENYRLPKPYPVTPAGGLWVFVFALLGAKIYWFIQYGDLREIYQALYIWQGGLVFYGGLFGGVVGAVAYIKFVKAPVLPLADIAMPYLPLAHGIARLGCFMNGCCWGAVAPDLPWAVTFPRRTSPYLEHIQMGLIEPGSPHSLPVHPTQLYESFGLVAIFLIMLWFYKRHRLTGSVALLYPFLYGILRFTVEQFRGDSAHPVLNMTASQIVALIFVLGSSLTFVVLKSTVWRGERLLGPKRVYVRPQPPLEEAKETP